MALTYTWELTGLKKENTDIVSDVIIGTQWKVTCTDEDGNTGAFNGATPFKASDVDINNFTQYSELTQNQVLGWIKEVVSGSNPSTNYWGHINGRIMDQINSTKYSRVDVSSTDFPWSSESGSANIAPAAPSGSSLV
jgi:hypothetical protein